MFSNTIPGMSVTVSGGTAEENNQFCTALAAGMRMIGFNNVQLDASCEYPVNAQYDGDILNAMHRLNPDLFDTPVAIMGESEDEIRNQMLAMGLPPEPFSFQIENVRTF